MPVAILALAALMAALAAACGWTRADRPRGDGGLSHAELVAREDLSR